MTLQDCIRRFRASRRLFAYLATQSSRGARQAAAFWGNRSDFLPLVFVLFGRALLYELRTWTGRRLFLETTVKLETVGEVEASFSIGLSEMDCSSDRRGDGGIDGWPELLDDRFGGKGWEVRLRLLYLRF